MLTSISFSKAIVMREVELWRDKIHLKRRGMIQDSMELFTRRCVELDVTPGSVDTAMTQVFTEAAELIQNTLDVDGTIIVDLAAFELVETVENGSVTTRYQADPYAMACEVEASDQSGEHTPVEDQAPGFLQRQSSSGALPPLPILASTGSLPDKEKLERKVPAEEHRKLAQWLKENPDGKIFEGALPNWARRIFPSNTQFGMVRSSPCRRHRSMLTLLLCHYLRSSPSSTSTALPSHSSAPTHAIRPRSSSRATSSSTFEPSA